MTGLLDWMTVPLSYPFMQRALVVSLMVGAVCAVLSCYLVLKGWSLMGDAISHAVLPGIVIAFVLGLPLAAGAFAAGLACALLTGYLKENSRVKEDTVMGIVFSGMFGFGLVLFTKVETDQHLNHILFGNVLGVTLRDLAETAVIAGGTLLVVLLKRRDLLLYCFDPNHARAIGLPVRVLHYGLLTLLSLTIVGSLKAVGIILVIAMLVAPGATAYLLTDRFDRMLVIATAVATASCAIGTIASFHIDGATGACIVLVQTAFFVLAFLFAPKRGFVSVRRRRAKMMATTRFRALTQAPSLKNACYTRTMLEKLDIDRIARDVATTTLTSDGVVSVDSSPMMDSSGDAALRIRIVLTPESTAAISGRAALDTLLQLQQRLQASGDHQFPIIEYATPEEMESAAT